MTAQQAAKLLLDGLTDPWNGDRNISGFQDIDWHKVYSAMTKDHNENIQISGSPDWCSTLIAGLQEIAGEYK